jgi:hypothetical protein
MEVSINGGFNKWRFLMGMGIVYGGLPEIHV